MVVLDQIAHVLLLDHAGIVADFLHLTRETGHPSLHCLVALQELLQLRLVHLGLDNLLKGLLDRCNVQTL